MVRKIVQGIRSQKAIPIRKGIGFREGVRYNSSTPGGLRSSPGTLRRGPSVRSILYLYTRDSIH